jgi:hypothetical protein
VINPISLEERKQRKIRWLSNKIDEEYQILLEIHFTGISALDKSIRYQKVEDLKEQLIALTLTEIVIIGNPSYNL